MKALSFLLSAVAVCVVCLSSCSRVDDHRIPAVDVNIVFTTEGVWARYGVTAAGEHKRFIRTATMKVPADFPFTANTFTGYGGVLLVCDMLGSPQAYDLSCPVEVKPDIRVEVNEYGGEAVCPKCGSRYDVFMGYGRPVSGPAADKGYGLTVYHVHEPQAGLTNRYISR